MAKVLVMMPGNPGDVLMATPAVRALAHMGHEVHFLVDDECEALLEGNPGIRKRHVLKRREIRKRLSAGTWKTGVIQIKEFLGQLYREQFDRVVNLFQGSATALLAGLLDCSDTSGAFYTRRGRARLMGDFTSLLYAVPFARRYVPAHASDLYTIMAGAKPDAKPLSLFLPPAAKLFARKLVDEHNLNASRLVVLHPCAAHEKKEWPARHYAALISTLDSAGYGVVLTGAAAEKDRAAEIIKHAGVPSAVNLCGRASLIESAAVIAEAGLLVSGDTVAMHMGAAVSARVIAVFAPTSPLETGPYAGNCVVFRAECLCSGNYRGPCRLGKTCTGDVRPDAVFREIEGRPAPPSPQYKRYISAFDSETGVIDYRTAKGQSGYAPAARALLNEFLGLESMDPVSMTITEKKSLSRFTALLNENADCLNRLGRSQAQDDAFSAMLVKNREIERELNGLSGPGAYLSAFLRLKNNAVEAERFSDVAEAMMQNARGLSAKVKRIAERFDHEAGSEKAPLVSIIMLSDPAHRGQAQDTMALETLLEYSNIQLFQVGGMSQEINHVAGKSDGDYLLFLDSRIWITPGFLNEMVRTLEGDRAFGACLCKVLRENETVDRAGLAFTQDGRTAVPFQGLQRFDPGAGQYRFFQAAETGCLLVRKEAFAAAGGFSPEFTGAFRTADLTLKITQTGKKLIYCPDAEVYVTGADEEGVPAASGPDEKRFFEKWQGKITPDAQEYA